MAAPLVLLHPFPVDGTFWEPLRAQLRTERRVLAPDLPGFGGAPRVTEPRMEALADAVAGTIAGLPGGRAVVAGLSLGGYVTLALVARRPELVAGLALLDTRAEADDEAGRARRDGALAAIGAGGLPAFLEGFLPSLMAPGAPPRAREALAAMAARQPVEGVRDALMAMRGRADRVAGLRDIALPTLVLVGAEDTVTPLPSARTMAELIPGAELRVVPGAGHMSALEDPAAVARELEAFLARCP
jgi:pimeloyl-ACP methyl ester carboxylesterase